MTTTNAIEITPETDAATLASTIELRGELPEAWKEWPNTHAAELLLLQRAVDQAEAAADPPPGFEGRGIVIGAGGAKFFACAFNCVMELRRLGCELPVELWFLHEGEMDPQMMAAVEALTNTRLVDATAEIVKRGLKPRRLNGWELKPFSVMWSAFSEVIYLDADIVPAVDVEAVFDFEGYREHGSMFWPDLPPARRKEWLPPQCWTNVGLTYRNEPDFESGQLAVDKRRCWSALQLTMFMNEHSDWYYSFVFGDKSTWHLAWRRIGLDYGMADYQCGWKAPCILQYGEDGKLFTQHACQGKEIIAAGDTMRCLIDPATPARAAKVLANYWDGQIYSWNAMTDAEVLAAEAMEGLYRYQRVGHGTRDLRLSRGGAITDGGAACEKRWSIQLDESGEATLTIIGDAHKQQEVGMMRLRKDGETWRGRWLWHERNAVTLEPFGPAELHRPPWWKSRAGTWDLAIFDDIVTNNEYRLPARLKPGVAIMDVGAHTGAFSFACLRRGAARCVSYEPHGGNFELLSQNLYTLGHRSECHRAAIWRPGLDRLPFFPSADQTNTGGGGCCARAGLQGATEMVPAVSLDVAIEDAVRGSGFERVNILKMDCEGAEFPSLMSATRLDLVDFIMGEFHPFVAKPGDAAYLDLDGNGGPDHFTPERLADHLERQGFNVKVEPTAGGLGHIWAGRPEADLHY